MIAKNCFQNKQLRQIKRNLRQKLRKKNWRQKLKKKNRRQKLKKKKKIVFRNYKYQKKVIKMKKSWILKMNIIMKFKNSKKYKPQIC